MRERPGDTAPVALKTATQWKLTVEVSQLKGCTVYGKEHKYLSFRWVWHGNIFFHQKENIIY